MNVLEKCITDLVSAKAVVPLLRSGVELPKDILCKIILQLDGATTEVGTYTTYDRGMDSITVHVGDKYLGAVLHRDYTSYLDSLGA